MSSDFVDYRFRSQGPEQTYSMGAAMGRLLQQHQVVLLTGDLGSGKTCFVQGLARGLEVPQAYDITSPTYTLIHEYPGRLTLLHVDLYRIASLDDVESIGLWELLTRPAVIAVEWADRLEEEHWPGDALRIAFSGPLDDSRCLTLFGHGLEEDNLISKLAASWSQIAQQLR
jgi:tRNA threonylcarbamoyladenosine biosynthesis protein TsaE